MSPFGGPHIPGSSCFMVATSEAIEETARQEEDP
jgi:hypothetical protein